MTVKARIQGNAVMVTLPKSLNIAPGTVFEPTVDSQGVIKLIPVKEIPDTIEELFENWKGEYEIPDDLKDWDYAKALGDEVW